MMDAAAAMTDTCLCRLLEISRNLTVSRPLMMSCVMKYCILSRWQNASPSSIVYWRASTDSRTCSRCPFDATSCKIASQLCTFLQNTFASALSECTSADAWTTPAMRKASGATHGSSFAKANNPCPATAAAEPMAPLASLDTVPATSAAVPVATVTAAAASKLAPIWSAPSALDSFLGTTSLVGGISF